MMMVVVTLWGYSCPVMLCNGIWSCVPRNQNWNQPGTYMEFVNSSAEGIHFQEPAMSAINQGIVLQIVQGSEAQF